MAKILLVEDNEMNRDMLSRRLMRKGYDVVIAVDGCEGVTLASSERPDLILMDMSLPVLDGWEATRRLKADPGTAGIIVLIGFTIILVVGVRFRSLVWLGGLALLLAVVGWFGILKDYQKRRVLTFLNPEHDAHVSLVFDALSLAEVGCDDCHGS